MTSRKQYMKIYKYIKSTYTCVYILLVENLVGLFMWKAALCFPEHLEGRERTHQWFKENSAIAKMRQLLIQVVHEKYIESECIAWLNSKKYLHSLLIMKKLTVVNKKLWQNTGTVREGKGKRSLEDWKSSSTTARSQQITAKSDYEPRKQWKHIAATWRRGSEDTAESSKL